MENIKKGKATVSVIKNKKVIHTKTYEITRSVQHEHHTILFYQPSESEEEVLVGIIPSMDQIQFEWEE